MAGAGVSQNNFHTGCHLPPQLSLSKSTLSKVKWNSLSLKTYPTIMPSTLHGQSVFMHVHNVQMRPGTREEDNPQIWWFWVTGANMLSGVKFKWKSQERETQPSWWLNSALKWSDLGRSVCQTLSPICKEISLSCTRRCVAQWKKKALSHTPVLGQSQPSLVCYCLSPTTCNASLPN